MFDRFQQKVLIEGKLRATTALRIGVGRATLDVSAGDLPVLKGPSGQPLLPGSSLKGVVRSAIEALLRGGVPAGAEAKVACDRHVRPCLPDGAPDEGSAAQRALAQRERLKKLCLTCLTFGAPGRASHVVFRDAYAEGDPPVERRDGVAIDRDLGRVSGARKYDFDVLPAGTVFPFGLTLDSPVDWQEGLVVVGLDLLADRMLRVGGMTSRGLGEVELTDLSVRVLDREAALQGTGPVSRAWEGYRKEKREAWAKHWKAVREEAAAC